MERADDLWWLPGENWDVGLGGGVAASPEFPGASDFSINPIPFFDVRYKGRYFLNAGQGLGAILADKKPEDGLGYQAGLAISASFQTRDADDVPGVPEVDRSAVARVFGELRYANLTLGATVVQDVFGIGHEGVFLDIDLQADIPIEGFGLLQIGPFARIAGKDFMSSFYSVTPQASAASGLAPFDAGAGFSRSGLRLLSIWRISEHWEMFAIARYARLIGDAGDSPVTAEDDQFAFVTAFAYRF